jgi:hypothetical protein
LVRVSSCLCLLVTLSVAQTAQAASFRVGSFAKTTQASQTVVHDLGEVPRALIL